MKRIVALLFVLLMISNTYADTINSFKIENGKKYYYDKNGNLAKDRWVVIDGEPYFADKSGEILTNTFTPDCIFVDEFGRYKYNGHVDISLQELDKYKNFGNIEISIEMIENRNNGCLVLKSVSRDSLSGASKNKILDKNDAVSSLAEKEINKIIDEELKLIKDDLRKYRSAFFIINHHDRDANKYSIHMQLILSLKGQINKPQINYHLNFDFKNNKFNVRNSKKARAHIAIFNPFYYNNNLYYYEKEDILVKSKTISTGQEKFVFDDKGRLIKDNLKSKLFELNNKKFYLKENGDYAISEWVNIDGKETGFSQIAEMLVNETDGIYVADEEGHKVCNNWLIVHAEPDAHKAFYCDSNCYMRLQCEFAEIDIINEEDNECHFCKKENECAIITYYKNYKKGKSKLNKEEITYNAEYIPICLDCFNKGEYKKLIDELNITTLK